MPCWAKGQKPAIEIGRSVSRVGGAAQASMMKKIVGPLKLEMSQYDEIARFAKFGTDVNETTQRQLKRGERLQALFSQGPHQPVSMARQVVGYYALVNDFLDEVDPGEVPTFVEALLNRIALSERQILDELEDSGTLSDKTEDELPNRSSASYSASGKPSLSRRAQPRRSRSPSFLFRGSPDRGNEREDRSNRAAASARSRRSSHDPRRPPPARSANGSSRPRSGRSPFRPDYLEG